MEKKRSSLSDIKTALGSKITSKTEMKGSEYLKMFLLEKKKTRLGQEQENLERRMKQIGKDLIDIEEELVRLEEVVQKRKNDSVNEATSKEAPTPSEAIKTMSVDY
ncbi:MAG: hypothetical protein SVY10_02475 [Thermodesulfobacteriota bacterium]|nr:hypothetical protein [Thermodesulfobacteriota bacterium]